MKCTHKITEQKEAADALFQQKPAVLLKFMGMEECEDKTPTPYRLA